MSMSPFMTPSQSRARRASAARRRKRRRLGGRAVRARRRGGGADPEPARRRPGDRAPRIGGSVVHSASTAPPRLSQTGLPLGRPPLSLSGLDDAAAATRSRSPSTTPARGDPVQPGHRPGAVAAQPAPARADGEPHEDDDRADHREIRTRQRSGADDQGGRRNAGGSKVGVLPLGPPRPAREHALRPAAPVRQRRRGRARPACRRHGLALRRRA